MTYRDLIWNQTTKKRTLKEFWMGVTSNVAVKRKRSVTDLWRRVSQQFQMFNKNTEGMWCVSLNYVQCNIFYMNVFCQFLAIFLWRLPNETDDSNGLELFIENLSKEPSENSY